MEIEKVNIKKLTGNLNYDMWKFRVLLVIEAKGLRKFIDGTAVEPVQSKTPGEWQLWNKKKFETIMLLLNAVDDSMLPFLAHHQDPKDIWIRLEALYGQNIINQLTNIANGKFLTQQEKEDNEKEGDNIYSKKIANIWNGACIKENKKEEMEIDIYSEKMAIIWNEIFLNEDNEDKIEKVKNIKPTSSLDICCDIIANNMFDESHVWITNPGIKQHMTSRREFFSHFEQLNETPFVNVDNKVLKIYGTGSINFQVQIDGKFEERQMINVLYVPDLKMNLFSIVAVLENGFSFHSHKYHCEVRDKNNRLSCLGVCYKINVFRLFFQVQVP
ncbi:uncharacterized protein LOC127276572 [Leptopilina boulardi]|uniref:uncharacterized protein LOC127276572 n=1 Tax=Leptopilina boulardi TaxID=63433 RepID=UPI0021F5A578|nr:uncharacterized protein LOC127276572 [Leptopilina boulardi]